MKIKFLKIMLMYIEVMFGFFGMNRVVVNIYFIFFLFYVLKERIKIKRNDWDVKFKKNGIFFFDNIYICFKYLRNWYLFYRYNI